MKKLISVFSLLILISSLVCLGLPGAEVSAAGLSETVYASTDVNVRSGPGTDHSIIGVLSRGESVERTNSGSDGWSEVIWNGSQGYVRSRYLSAGSAHDQEHLHDAASAAFDAVNETVYANTDVNVRTGPGTQYETLDQCALGRSLRRTGIGSNGWSRVIYMGQVGYVRTKYLSETKAEAKSKGVSNLNVYGQLTIPEVGIDVKLYYCSSGAENATELAQNIVDAEDSAAFLDQARIDGVIIADHKHQGFDAIRLCIPKQTIAYIDYGTKTQKYICTAIGKGKNTGSNLLDWDGNSLNYDSIPGGLAMYTCNESWEDITITYWKQVK